MNFLRVVFIIVKFILGIIYTIAGFLKAIDINNTQLKIEEYLRLFGLSHLNSFSSLWAFLLVGLELFVGISILFDLNKKIISKVTFLLTILMLIITAYIYIYNPIEDCGCFGSMFVIDNDDTFYKNILLTVFAIIYIRTYSYSSILVYTFKSRILVTAYFTIYICIFIFYGYRYHPMIDISKYHVGYSFNKNKNNAKALDYIFKNDKGVEHIFSDDIAPWNDDSWSFVKVVEQSNYHYSDICFNKLIFDTDSIGIVNIKDVTDELFHGVSMLIVVDNLSEIDATKNHRYYNFLQQVKQNLSNIYYVTSETTDNILNSIDSIPYRFNICQTDNTFLKNILNNEKMQFILLVDGIIVKKWYSNNLPNNIDFSCIDSFVKESSFYYLKRVSLVFILTFIFPLFLIKFYKKDMLIIFVLFLFSCKNEDTKPLEKALTLAGKNKIELENVLQYFRTDSLKLKAAEFLIINMAYHHSYRDTLLVKAFYNEIDSVLLNDNYNNIEQSILALEKKYKIHELATVPDLQIVSSNYLISNINQAFEVWQDGEWSKHINFNQFCEYILPYKIEEYQVLDDWRSYLKPSFSKSLNLLKYCDIYKNSALRASIEVNNYIKTKISPRIVYYNHNSIRKLSTLSKMPYGVCNDYSNLTASVFRSIGLPATYDFTPQWPFRSLGHTWNVVLANNGKFIAFNGGGDNPGSPINFDEKMCKVYRKTFSVNTNILDLIKIESTVPELFRTPFFIDVTNEYMTCSDIELSICKPKVYYGYIAVFNDMRWIPVDFSRVINGKLKFHNIGRNIVYMPLYYNKFGTEGYLSSPILLGYDGKCKILKSDTVNKQDIIIRRKYPVFQDVYQASLRLIGGEFQASNNKDFKDAETIFKINEPLTSGYDICISDTIQSYRYWRYYQPEVNTYCNMAEISFWNGEQKLKGKIIGTNGSWDNRGSTKEKVFDDDLLTFFDSPISSKGWVGMDFGVPQKVSNILFTGRGDGNSIELDDVYELFYWDDVNGWLSLGKKKAHSFALKYDSVPTNALFLLKDISKGKEQRIFTYENDRQIWW